MNVTGVSDALWDMIINVCTSFSSVKRIIVYGSRARGDYRTGSDIDIAIDAPNMTDAEFSRLWNSLDDLPIIYTMDIVHLQGLKNQPLLEAIAKEGRVIWP